MLGYLLYLNWQLTLIALATIPLLAVSLRKIRRR
jgi:ABC-type bacteriocin/lantibiotic exporter with double-glycine peptidase domain